MTKYKIVSYVRAEDYDPIYFDSIGDAEVELNNLELSDPCRDNYYVIEEIESDDLLPSNPVERNALLSQLGAIAEEDYEDTDIVETKDYNSNDPVNW
tara:strand:+ start:347 stop:637 length:291 start_codon:yes stop_codon:yes gene_type:complete